MLVVGAGGVQATSIKTKNILSRFDFFMERSLRCLLLRVVGNDSMRRILIAAGEKQKACGVN